jgi:hypothetical protein
MANYYHDKTFKAEDLSSNPYADKNRKPLGDPLSVVFQAAAEAKFEDHQDNIVAFYSQTEFCRAIHYGGKYYDYADGNEFKAEVVAELPIPKFNR